jgi:type III restriction enzyme
MKLKNYQNAALLTLRDFLTEAAETGDIANAFSNATEKHQDQRLPYIPVNITGLSQVPYVCLRVPTGGGKTVMACQAAGDAQRLFLRRDGGVVLWLVPSNPILEQTLQTLRNPKHFNRRILEEACGSVSVYSIDEALCLPMGSTAGNTVVIVSTIQSFRIDETEGRKVFTGNSDGLGAHFKGAPIPAIIAANLEKSQESGQIIPSLANVIRMNRPVIIVDEAHNARTDLSFATLGKLLPSCIIEFTATPDTKKVPSNLLYRVTAGQLKVENMVKLPLHVLRRDASQKEALIADAIQMREDLEAFSISEAQRTNEYIRPILLFQAPQIDDCQPLAEHLIQTYPNIKAENIAISHGKHDDLAKIEDLEDPKCQVRMIITVQKLKEGWDCPFAYVLCSLKNSKSKSALEQIVGRILRLPKVTPKITPQLNRAYAYSLSDDLRVALKEFVEALEANGFSKAEIEEIIIPTNPAGHQGGLFEQPEKISLEPETEINHDELAAFRNSSLTTKVAISATGSEITIFSAPTEAEETQILALGHTPDAKKKIAAAIESVKAREATFGALPVSPHRKGEQFRIPLLCHSDDEQGTLEFEKTFILERAMPIDSSTDAGLGKYDPDNRPRAVHGTVDVSSTGGIGEQAATDADQEFIRTLHDETFILTSMSATWSREELIGWLASNIPHQDIHPGHFGAYLTRILNGLTAGHEETPRIKSLVSDRFRLCAAIQSKLRILRESAQRKAFNEFLFEPDELEKITIGQSDDHILAFDAVSYTPNFPYAGTYGFKNHFYGPKPGDLKPNGEEHDCAIWLDQHPQIEFWVRNLSQKSSSFRLLTPHDWYYPDFVAKLKDGRILVLEYKGKHLYDLQESIDKRAVGAVWQAKMNGKGIHVMTNGPDYETTVGNPIK